VTAVAARRTVFALLAAALVLATAGNCPGLGPRQWERTGNQPVRPAFADAAVEPTLTPPGAGARLVLEQVRDLRGGTP
jgi:hypothetical protein